MSDDLIKIAQEYDSAGRIMARGFVDEFDKLAENAGLQAIPPAAKPNAGQRNVGTPALAQPKPPVAAPVAKAPKSNATLGKLRAISSNNSGMTASGVAALKAHGR
jgi:hypothetical protein